MAIITAPQHLEVAEIQTETGWRYWTSPMSEQEMREFLSTQPEGSLSDLCCSTQCPACQ